MAIASAADPDPWRNQFRAAWERTDKETLTKLAVSDQVTTLPAATLYLLGSVLRETHNTLAAEKLLRKAQQLYPDDFWINYELAICCSHVTPRLTDDAIRFHTAAIAIRKQSAEPYRSIAPLLASKGRLDEAIAANKVALRLKPDFWTVHHNLGTNLLKQGKLDEAIASFREAIRINPKWSWPHGALGSALSEKGLFHEAQAACQEALSLGPNDSTVLTMVGVALSKQGKLDEAINCYRKAIELDPEDAGACNDLAWLLAMCPDPKFRDPRLAVELAQKAVELATMRGDFWNTLGIAHYRAGEWKDAIDALKKSDELLQGEMVSFNAFFLAMAQWQLGEREAARKWFDKAVEWMDKNEPKNEKSSAVLEQRRLSC